MAPFPSLNECVCECGPAMQGSPVRAGPTGHPELLGKSGPLIRTGIRDSENHHLTCFYSSFLNVCISTFSIRNVLGL